MVEKTMSELIDELTDNELAQFAIYEAYRKAAEMDLTFRKLKDEERRIRRDIAIKVNIHE